MLRRIAALLLLVLGLLAAPSRADPYTHAFDTLRTSVLARIAELTGTLTPAEAKEKAALDKIAALLAAPSSGLAGDVNTGKKIAAAVKKGGLLESPIGAQLLDSISGLAAELSALITSLQMRLKEIPHSALRDKAEDALTRISRKLDSGAGGTDPLKLAKALLSPTKGTGKAAKTVSKAEAASGITPCTPGVVSVTATLDGVAWQSQTGDGTLLVNSLGRTTIILVNGYRGGDPNADRVEIGISLATATVFTGTRVYAVNGGSISVRHRDPSGGIYVGLTGTLTFDEVDPDARRIKGSFDVDAGPYPNPAFSDRHFSGTFEISCAKVTRL